ncbi:type I secretion C-terminal target domain-containing protein, partial [Castellaniella sp.]|uniref:type I secretion C-terminal target domain-containing protein n=1 Tax=Castellaniella sp. TaxID=1955812 RepID=UPI0035636E11
TVPRGETAITVTVPTHDDGVFEGDEFFTLDGALTGTVNGVPFGGAGEEITATGTGGIIDADSLPLLVAGETRVSEEGLEHGLPDDDGVDDTTDSPTSEGSIGITHPHPTIVTLGLPSEDALQAGGEDVEWALSGGDRILTGSVQGQPVVTITIDNNGRYEVELHQPVDHPDTTQEDVIDFEVPISVRDIFGNSAHTTLKVTVEDDAPEAIDDSHIIMVPVSEVIVTGLEGGFTNVKYKQSEPAGTNRDRDSDAYYEELRWGTASSSGTGKSGYDYYDNEDFRSNTDNLIGSTFKLGTFTHLNNSISTGSGELVSTDLVVKFIVSIDGQPHEIEHTIRLTHTETPNNSGSAAGDRDIVAIDASTLSSTFTVGDRTFEFTIDGFKNDEYSDPVSTVYTWENSDNVFDLYATISAVDDMPTLSGEIEGSIQVGADGPADAGFITWEGATDNGDGTYTITNDYGTFTGHDDGSYTFEMSRSGRDGMAVGDEEEMRFSYTVTDRDGDSASADVIITLKGEPNEPDSVFAQIRVDEDAVAEGDDLHYTVTLVDKNGDPVEVPAGKSVQVKLAWEGEAANNTDTLGRPASVTIGAGQNQATFVVRTVDDTNPEPQEDVTVRITGVEGAAGIRPGGGMIGEQNTASSVIHDDDLVTFTPQPEITNVGLSVSAWTYQGPPSGGRDRRSAEQKAIDEAINDLLDGLRAGTGKPNGSNGDGANTDLLESTVKALDQYAPNGGYQETADGRKHGYGGPAGERILDSLVALNPKAGGDTDKQKNVAVDTAVHAHGIIYLKAGETYIVKAQGDDSLRVVLGDRENGGQQVDLRWGTDKSTFKDFEFTAAESGLYTFDMYMHNQNGAGMYNVSIVNKASPGTPIEFFPDFDTAQAQLQDQNEGFTLGGLIGTEDHGHYRIYGYNEGEQGQDIALTQILPEYWSPDDATVSMTGLPDGAVLRDGDGHVFVATPGHGPADLSGWDTESLVLLSNVPGSHTLTVTVNDSGAEGFERSHDVQIRIDPVEFPDGITTLSDGSTNPLIGSDATDVLVGGDGDDVLIGGRGDDFLVGGAGDDVFKWEFGDEGSVAHPASDTILDFGTGPADPRGADRLDLSELLDADTSGSLDQYLRVEESGADTVIKVDTGGQVGAGHFDQEIILKGVSFADLGLDAGSSQNDLINKLIDDGKLDNPMG